MSTEKYLELVEKLLVKNNPGYTDSYAQLAWERGYLTGLLAVLAKNDTFVSSELINRLKNPR
jgi:hypothetical protein